MKKKGIHDNHRKRVREEFLKKGFDLDTPPHKIIEMLLFYSIPRKDTNETAHLLLDKFGSIEALLEANPKEIMKVNGCAETTAALIKLVQTISKYYINEKKKSDFTIGSLDDIHKYIFDRYIGVTEEEVAITSLDNRLRIVGFDVIGKGDVSSALASTRKAAEAVMARKATIAVLSHNHPGDYPLPSGDDIKTTEKMYAALRTVKVRLIDHVIIGNNEYVSLFKSSKYKYLFKDKEEEKDNKD